MRIGILTHPLDYNYGCLLQAFALQKTLKDMGHEVITINRYSNHKKPFHVQLKDWLRRIALYALHKTECSLVWNPIESMKTKQILSSNTQKFVDRNICNTGPVFPKDLEALDQKYKFDAYVVGSDQVWLPNFSLNSFLDFVHRDNVKRLFYAASSGAKCFADDPLVLAKCKDLIKSFSGISVREDTLIKVVKENLGRDAVQVLDPTLLLDSTEYLKACDETIADSPVIFTYILDKTSEKQALVDRIQKDLKLPVVKGSVDIDYVKGKRMDINKCIYPSVDHWLSSINRAKFVITDSFHGTCMSIVFRKPFVVIGNAQRGINRFISVLKLFHLEDRLLTSTPLFTSDLYSELDDSLITELLNEMRRKSISYLKSYLS